MATFINKATRGPGTFRSAWHDVRGIAQPNTPYAMTPLMDQLDIDDPNLTMTLTIEVSDDGVGQRDYVIYSTDLRMGRTDRNGNPIHTAPIFTTSTSSDPPNFIRAKADLSRSLSIGLGISLAGA